MSIKSQIACSALALAGAAGCTTETSPPEVAPLVAATPAQCPVCTPGPFTITLPKPSPTPAPTASPTPAPTASPAPTAAPTPAPTASPTPSPTASPIPSPTASPIPSPTATSLAMPTPDASALSSAIDLAAALSSSGKACLDGGGTLIHTSGVIETSSSFSADYTCDCGGAP